MLTQAILLALLASPVRSAIHGTESEPHAIPIIYHLPKTGCRWDSECDPGQVCEVFAHLTTDPPPSRCVPRQSASEGIYERLNRHAEVHVIEGKRGWKESHDLYRPMVSDYLSCNSDTDCTHGRRCVAATKEVVDGAEFMSDYRCELDSAETTGYGEEDWDQAVDDLKVLVERVAAWEAESSLEIQTLQSNIKVLEASDWVHVIQQDRLQHEITDLSARLSQTDEYVRQLSCLVLFLIFAASAAVVILFVLHSKPS